MSEFVFVSKVHVEKLKDVSYLYKQNWMCVTKKNINNIGYCIHIGQCLGVHSIGIEYGLYRVLYCSADSPVVALLGLNIWWTCTQIDSVWSAE